MTLSRPIRLKICGMREAENILSVGALDPDYMGFIFYRNSKRFVGDDFAIPKKFPAAIKRIGVFVNETTPAILERARRYSLNGIQLHGEESPEACAALMESSLSVIKVFAVGDKFDFAVLTPYKKVVNYFMFDTKGPEYGGNGKVFDWRLLENYDQDVPFFLSGGLSASNVHEVKKLKGMNLHGLDVNSGVESEPGVKDTIRIEKLMREIEKL